MAGGLHPDHDTLAHFRKTFLPQISELFVQVLLVAADLGVLKVGRINVSFDGSKVHADASKSHAVSYDRLLELEKQLRHEVAELLALGEQVDQAALPEALDVAHEVALRQQRLGNLAKAKQILEARAQERDAAEQAAYEAKLQARQAKAQETGRKPGGRAPQPPPPGPRPEDQYNFTDPDSRIMKNSTDQGFNQAYNVQAVVDQATLLVVGNRVTNHPNDKKKRCPPWMRSRPPWVVPRPRRATTVSTAPPTSRAWKRATSSPTSRPAASRTARTGGSPSPSSPHRRLPMPALWSRWPTSCAPNSAKPFTAGANAPWNPCLASSRKPWGFGSFRSAVWGPWLANGVWFAGPATSSGCRSCSLTKLLRGPLGAPTARNTCRSHGGWRLIVRPGLSLQSQCDTQRRLVI